MYSSWDTVQSPGKAPGGKAGDLAAARTDEFLRIDVTRFVLVEHREYLLVKCQPLIFRYGAVPVGIDLVHERHRVQAAGVARRGKGHHVVRARSNGIGECEHAGSRDGA